MPQERPIPLDYRSLPTEKSSARRAVLSAVEWVLFVPVLYLAISGALIVIGSLLAGHVTPIVVVGAFVGAIVLVAVAMTVLLRDQ